MGANACRPASYAARMLCQSDFANPSGASSGEVSCCVFPAGGAARSAAVKASTSAPARMWEMSFMAMLGSAPDEAVCGIDQYKPEKTQDCNSGIEILCFANSDRKR